MMSSNLVTEASRLKGNDDNVHSFIPLLQLIFCNRAPTSFVAGDSTETVHQGFFGAPEDVSCTVCTFTSTFAALSVLVFALIVWRCNAQPQPQLEDCFSGAKAALINISIHVLINIIKVPVYRCFGFSDHSIVLARGRRDTWTTDTVHRFTHEYGERRIKILDAIFRRLMTILVSLPHLDSQTVPHLGASTRRPLSTSASPSSARPTQASSA